jgi:glutamate carboxypeptidase
MYKNNAITNKKSTLKLSRIFLLFIFLFTQIAKADNKSIEVQVSRYINTQRQEQLSLLEKLVNINSGTTNTTGIHQIGELLRPQFEELGFKVHWVKEPANMQRAGTLIAKHPGNKGKRVLVISHLDTVFL